MRILRVTRAYPPVWAGAANHVVGLSQQQARAGHRVWVLQPHLPDSSDDGTRVTQVHVRLPKFLERGIYESKASIAAFHIRASSLGRQIHRDHGIDIIHTHGDALDAFLQGRVARNCNVPLVQTVHGRLSRRWVYRYSAPRLLRRVTRFIAVAQTVAADLVALGIPEDRIAVISSGIDMGRFSGVAATRSPHIISIGRLHPVKGYPYLLAAVRLLAKSGLTPSVTIVGEGEQRKRLEALAEGLPNVHFTGAMLHEQIPEILSSGTIFVLSSIDLDGQAEGIPTVLMEAMAAGLPIVTTDAGGVTELVRHRINGVIVPQRSASALATAIKELLQDEASRRHMGDTNRARAAEKDWSMIERQAATVYEAALREHTQRAPSRA
ncbi:MAG: glycosyltransferase family 4 protein [bacterium]